MMINSSLKKNNMAQRKMKKALVTGSAGFIGAALSKRLLEQGYRIIGVDNFNDYYSPDLKQDRVKNLAVSKDFTQLDLDIGDRSAIKKLFEENTFNTVINLAAQAGVRYSLENPDSYVDSNLVGFVNLLEGCRHSKVDHFVYASSSSVYGANKKMPFSVHDNVDHPVSLYAASKKANELMAHTYSHLFNLPTTGLRFFTVYGPWGRPDMAPILFADAIMAGKPINVFNNGNMERDFTYIDDIVEGVVQVIDKIPEGNPEWDGMAPDPSTSYCPYKIYNIGNNQKEKLTYFIEIMEKALGKKAEKNFLPMQPGDVKATYADISGLEEDFDYKPSIGLEEGVQRFAKWYLEYKYNRE